MLKRENWFWCSTCKDVSYRFDCCGNTLCNCGGCDECKDLIFHEAMEAYNLCEHPPESELKSKKSSYQEWED